LIDNRTEALARRCAMDW